MKTILLNNGKEAIVDDSDFDEISKYKWYGNGTSNGMIIYAKRRTKKSDGRKEKIISMHRQIMNFPEGKHIDHRNHNGLDNRHCNLRICTGTENMFNRRRLKNKSGFVGVSWFKRLKKWRSSVCLTIGYFDSKEEAARAYDEAAKKLFGEFANLNFPDDKKRCDMNNKK